MATDGKTQCKHPQRKRRQGRPKKKDAHRIAAESAAMLQDYLGGMTFEQVAEKYGFADATGPRERILRLMHQQVSPSAEAYRTECLYRLGALLSAVWVDAIGGSRGAVETASGLVEKIAKLSGADKLPPLTDAEETGKHCLKLDLSGGTFVIPFGASFDTDTTA